MKKNLKKADMQRPKVGDHYRLFGDEGLYLRNIIKILKVYPDDNMAIYICLNDLQHKDNWNYKDFPDCLKRKLTDLEVELL